MLPPRAELVTFSLAMAPGAEIVPIAGDASTRRFFRVVAPSGPSRIVMDYGAPFEGETDDIRMWRIFSEAGLPVAGVIRVSPETGCLVLEDLGSRTMEAALGEMIRGSGDPEPETAETIRGLYRQAVTLAVAVAERGTPVLARSDRAHGPALDRERFRFEMDFFVEHYVRGLRGVGAPRNLLIKELGRLADLAAESGPRVLCHRDFHSRNLMLRQDGSLAMVDIQDARWGPDTYDLASLLRDAYVDVAEDLVEEMLELYRVSSPRSVSRDEFRARFDVVAAQRMLKALGTFGYQIAVLGRDRYREGIPRTLERLSRLLPRIVSTRTLHELLLDGSLLDAPAVP